MSGLSSRILLEMLSQEPRLGAAIKKGGEFSSCKENKLNALYNLFRQYLSQAIGLLLFSSTKQQQSLIHMQLHKQAFEYMYIYLPISPLNVFITI